MADITLKGKVADGKREAGGFMAVPWVAEGMKKHLGYIPYPGTMNIKITDPDSLDAFRNLVEESRGLELVSPDPAFCNASLYPAVLNGKAPSAIIWPHVPGQPPDVVELVAPEALRLRFGLSLGDLCTVEVGNVSALCKKRTYRAVLFDFEGTLVDFQWKLPEAEEELRGVLVSLGFDLAQFQKDNYATLRTRSMDMARTVELKNEIDTRFGEIYDRYDFDALSRWNLKPGARHLLEKLQSEGVKVAIVSNIGRKGLSEALKVLSIEGVVETIVTRNDVTRAKPSGEGIKKVLASFGVEPEDALMVGDSLADILAGRDAGTFVVLLTGGEAPTDVLYAAGPDHMLADLAALDAIL